MITKNITFRNSQGQNLAAKLEMPEGTVKAFCLFAHCFTCNKNFTAVANISRALTKKNIAVLRFDFTGLGESEGDFANTNFSSNIEDLYAAAIYLEQNHTAPSMLIGHSLGGAAAISAAHKISSIRALVTIGAPSNPQHVSHLFQERDVEEIKRKGIATVIIGGRPFTVKSQFFENIAATSLVESLRKYDHSILVMHSPQDTTVAINNAKEIYHAARHPKSFISLDGADHLLTNREDSAYAATLIAAWSAKYI